MLGGLFLAAVVYILVAFTAAMVVDTETLAKSSGPLLEVVKAGPVPLPLALFSVIALMAISNTALINMIMASRLIYGMANQGIIPRVFARTHSSRRTPWVAIVFTTVIALGLAATGDIGALANTTVALLLAVFAIVNVAVLVLRKDRVAHEHFTVPSFVPILGAVSCALLLTRQDADIYLRAGVLLGVGIVLWVVNFAVGSRFEAAVAEPRR